jgi:hypothetical protein
MILATIPSEEYNSKSMVDPNADSPIPDSFDSEYLKSCPSPMLIEGLLDEAQRAAQQLSGFERERVDAELMSACWVPSQEDIDEQLEWAEEHRTLIGSIMSEAFTELTGEEIGTDEALSQIKGGTSRRALAIVDSSKQKITEGIAVENKDWTEGSTKHYLMQICEAQQYTGIALATDYVRETAIELLQMPDLRAVALLHNALVSRDTASYKPGIEALQESVSQERLGFDEAHEVLDILTQFIAEGDHPQHEILKDLAIDVVAHLRGWNGLFPNATARYAVMTAQLAVTFRDLG